MIQPIYRYGSEVLRERAAEADLSKKEELTALIADPLQPALSPVPTAKSLDTRTVSSPSLLGMPSMAASSIHVAESMREPSNSVSVRLSATLSMIATPMVLTGSVHDAMAHISVRVMATVYPTGASDTEPSPESGRAPCGW